METYVLTGIIKEKYRWSIKMIPLTNDKAREMFSSAGLTYADLDRVNLQSLRNLINIRMKKSECIKGTFRCKQRPFLHDKERFWAGIRCKSFYFDDREAVSFNPDGFIGFGGWADSKNIQPILEGFALWVGKMKSVKFYKKHGGNCPN